MHVAFLTFFVVPDLGWCGDALGAERSGAPVPFPSGCFPGRPSGFPGLCSFYSGLICLVVRAGTRRGPLNPPAWPNYWQRVCAITVVADRASLSVHRPPTQARCQVAARARKDVRWGNSALTFGGQATADFHVGPGPRFTGADREQGEPTRFSAARFALGRPRRSSGEKDTLFVLLVVAPEWPRLQKGKLPQFDCKDDKGCTETKFQSSTAPTTVATLNHRYAQRES